SDTLRPCFRSRLRSSSSLSHWPAGSINSNATRSTICVRRNRVLRGQLRHRRVRFTDDQRVRLAAKARKIGRRVLTEIGTLVTPDTLAGSLGRNLSACGSRTIDTCTATVSVPVVEPQTLFEDRRSQVDVR